jgi:hypothetical protein
LVQLSVQIQTKNTKKPQHDSFKLAGAKEHLRQEQNFKTHAVNGCSDNIGQKTDNAKDNQHFKQ